MIIAAPWQDEIEALLTLWRADGLYAPNPPAMPTAIRAFIEWHCRRLDSDPSPQFLHFLSLAEGGVCDNYVLDRLDGLIDQTEFLETEIYEKSLPYTWIGCNGNVDDFLLWPDGRCAMVNTFGHEELYEEFPDFASFLARLLRGSRERQQKKGG